MTVAQRIHQWCHRLQNLRELITTTAIGKSRRAVVETMEPRQLMTADPIWLGGVYVEGDTGSDAHGDSFYVSFNGGAEGTKLTRLIINTDQNAPGYGVGDNFFDIVDGELGADHSFGFSIDQLQTASPDASVKATVVDGGMQLILTFTNFQAGDLLVFSIDVDEIQQWDPAEKNLDIINGGIDPIASGVEFQGSRLIGEFEAPHYEAVDGTGRFTNAYDTVVDPAKLPIPRDNDNGKRDRSAGTALSLQQVPKPISLAGTVYEDQNRNLVQESGDRGIAGVQLALWRKEGTGYVDTGFRTTTDSQGNYRFGVELKLMPGTYQVRETQPANYLSVGAVPGSIPGVGTVGQIVTSNQDWLTEISIPLGDQHAVDLDFAEALPASIAGHVCLAMPGFDCFSTAPNSKTPLAGVQIDLLDGSGKKIATTLTATDGSYRFENLPSGVYTVVEFTPVQYIDGGAMTGSHGGKVENPSRIGGVTLAGGTNAVDYDFCELLPASLSGHVYEDRNDDGIRAANEPLLPGTTVRLFDETGTLVSQTVTDNQGFYRFSFLKPGKYRLVETTPVDYVDGKDQAGTILGKAVGKVDSAMDEISEILLASGTDGINYDFGELRPGSISGKVFADRDGDCLQDTDEAALAGVVIQLLNELDQVIAETQTDSQGRYAFANLKPGLYSVREQQPAGFLQGGQKIGSGGGDASLVDWMKKIPIGSGEQLVDYDFCEVPPAEIAGWVFVDNNGDCLIQPQEKGIGGVRIELYNQQNQLVAFTTTNGDGSYAFRNLAPGQYTVKEIQPAGYLQGGQKAGSGGGIDSTQDLIHSIAIGAGQQLTDYNFCEQLPASLSGVVFVDPNMDCIQSPGEESLSGVRVELLDEQGRFLQATTTDSEGRYRFENLAPGKYTVFEVAPAGYFHFAQMAPAGKGTTKKPFYIQDITLSSGEQLQGLDFCEIPPATISGYVFQDGPTLLTEDGLPPERRRSVRDGQRTPDDTPLPGVVLELRLLSGFPVDPKETIPGTYGNGVRVTTGADGYFEFRGLKPGTYSVYQIQPTGFVDSLDTPGPMATYSVNPEDLPTAQVGLTNYIRTLAGTDASNPRNDAILLIELNPGDHARDNNFSEILVSKQETPLFPPPPPTTPEPPPISNGTLNAPFERVLLADAPRPVQMPEYPLGGLAVPYTWHLSIVNAGAPRGVRLDHAVSKERIVRSTQILDITHWTVAGLKAGKWTIVSSGPKVKSVDARGVFNVTGAKALAGDFNGDGVDEVALFVAGEWLLDINGNGEWDKQDLWAKLGDEGDMPVVGDWDADGKDDIGIFGPEWRGDRPAIAREPGLPDPANLVRTKPKNLPPQGEEAPPQERLLQRNPQNSGRADLVDHIFRFGQHEDQAIAGDFNGDGIATVGVFRAGKWKLDVDGDGKFTERDEEREFGQAGDQAIVGDFDGDGLDEIAIVRNGQVIVDSNRNGVIDAADQIFELDNAVDQVVVGDFDGDGKDEPALHRSLTSEDAPLQARAPVTNR